MPSSGHVNESPLAGLKAVLTLSLATKILPYLISYNRIVIVIAL